MADNNDARSPQHNPIEKELEFWKGVRRLILSAAQLIQIHKIEPHYEKPDETDKNRTDSD